MDFERWWKLNKQYCVGQSSRYIALRAWSAVKTYHRIPEVSAVVCRHCGKPPPDTLAGNALCLGESEGEYERP